MENTDSVCYVSTIVEIKPIPDADKIEQAIIGGWSCVVQKGTHTPGQLVVVATTDAVIPQKLSDDLNVTSYLRKGQRVRTVKLRGVYSECLIIPIGFIPTRYRYDGSDCMELLEIFKYEPPVKTISLGGGKTFKYKENPNFYIYYKFPNIKNVPNMFNENDIVEISRKLHGTNARFSIVKKTKLSLWDKIKIALAKRINPYWIWSGYEFAVGSHHVEKGSDSQGFYSENVWFKINDMYSIKQKLWSYVKDRFTHDINSLGKGIIVYGEIYGAGIQKNYDYRLDGIEFRIFDIMIDGIYTDVQTTRFIASAALGLPCVEQLFVGKYSKETLDRFVFNNYIPGTKIPHEGVVVKCISGDRKKICKFVNPEYLIYSEKNNVGDSH